MKRQGNILFCGVGGQGVLLASEVTAYALIRGGYDIKKSEVHGMAQRGGSVVAHLRYGKKVYSPLIEPGTVDLQVSFELLESVRYMPYLSERSKVIVNSQKILPSSVSMGVQEYPKNVLEELRQRGLTVHPIDAVEVANSVGELRTVNMVLVGALSRFLPVAEKNFLDAIEGHVKKCFNDINIEAFKLGRSSLPWHSNLLTAPNLLERQRLRIKKHQIVR